MLLSAEVDLAVDKCLHLSVVDERLFRADIAQCWSHYKKWMVSFQSLCRVCIDGNTKLYDDFPENWKDLFDLGRAQWTIRYFI